MNKVGIFYGTDTNNTEMVGGKIQEQLQSLGIDSDMHNVTDVPVGTMKNYDTLILGIPTWDFGGIQSDWEDIGETLSGLDLSNKTIALYGLGDQFGYGDYFVDAMGWLYEKLQGTGATFVGQWSCEGYAFEASRACNADKTYFVGLAIDEDQQFNLTDERVENWVIQVYAEQTALAA